MSMAEPFLPAHEPADEGRAHRDTTFDDDDVLIEPDAEPAEVEPAADRDEMSPFRTPEAGDRLSAEELAEDLDRDEPTN